MRIAQQDFFKADESVTKNKDKLGVTKTINATGFIRLGKCKGFVEMGILDTYYIIGSELSKRGMKSVISFNKILLIMS